MSLALLTISKRDRIGHESAPRAAETAGGHGMDTGGPMHDNPTTRTIPLTKGYVALVDAADFEMLSHWRWSANLSHGSVYAATKVMSNGLRRELSMHRMVALPDPEQLVDHRNGDSLDNRRDNLRPSTNTQNQRNRRVIPGRSSRFKGVSWHERGQKWRAGIRVDGRWLYLGLFQEEREAALAYNAVALAEFGEFSLLNDIPTLP